MTVADHTQTYRVLHEARPGPRPMDVEILWSIPRVGAPIPSPGGHHLAVPVGTFSMEDNRGASRLWLVPTGGGKPRPLTSSDRHASQPAFSPGGGRMAFVARAADDPKAPAQLHVMPLLGGTTLNPASSIPRNQSRPSKIRIPTEIPPATRTVE